MGWMVMEGMESLRMMKNTRGYVYRLVGLDGRGVWELRWGVRWNSKVSMSFRELDVLGGHRALRRSIETLYFSMN